MQMQIIPSVNPTTGNPTLEFLGLPESTKLKVAGLAAVLQAALGDGKLTLTEDIMIGFALAALLSK